MNISEKRKRGRGEAEPHRPKNELVFFKFFEGRNQKTITFAAPRRSLEKQLFYFSSPISLVFLSGTGISHNFED